MLSVLNIIKETEGVFMKNIKNILIITISLTISLTSGTLSAAPSFELYNKADAPIGVVIQELGWPRREHHIIQSMEPLPLNINIAHVIYISIFEDTNTLKELDLKQNDPSASKEFRIHAKGKKTAYLSWDPAKPFPLYPQTGRYMGLMPLVGLTQITASGLEFTKETNIERTPEKEQIEWIK